MARASRAVESFRDLDPSWLGEYRVVREFDGEIMAHIDLTPQGEDQ